MAEAVKKGLQGRENSCPVLTIPAQAPGLSHPNPGPGSQGHSRAEGERATPGRPHHRWTGSAGTGEGPSEDPPAPEGQGWVGSWLSLPCFSHLPLPQHKLSQAPNGAEAGKVRAPIQ